MDTIFSREKKVYDIAAQRETQVRNNFQKPLSALLLVNNTVNASARSGFNLAHIKNSPLSK